jgi:putative ABC transport system permease protein
MGTLWQDLKYATRMLQKNPGFTTVAVLTLALGIGANSAIFSVIDAVLLKPLPFKDAGRLVIILESNLKDPAANNPVSAGNFVDWKDRTSVFEQVAGWP